MPASATVGAVLYAKDIARVSRFYAEVCGLTRQHAEADHIVLASTTFQLTVVAIPASIADGIIINTPPVRREGTPIKLVFPVAGIDLLRATAIAMGGALNSPDREWSFQGVRVCDGHDPEGNVLQLREYAA